MTSNDVDTDPVPASSLIWGWSSTEQLRIALRNERFALTLRVCALKREIRARVDQLTALERRLKALERRLEELGHDN